ncbi:MAG: cell division ATPase MinD [Candidatus Aenigmatarchaeota archaeon]|nr:MAG: cell division ATPase MinD [Candidatus Aenigmarchaeota archaeon]
MTRIISVVSGKGGVGKTTLVANLGAYFAEIGKNVLVVDGNLSGANLGLHLDLSDSYPFSLNMLLKGEIPLSEAVYRHFLGFDIIPASIVDMRINPRRLKHILKDLAKGRDFIIIDSAPGITHEALASIESSDEVILITGPEMPSIVDIMRSKKLAEGKKKRVVGVVVNRTSREDFEVGPHHIEDILDSPVIANIPEHKKVKESIAMKIPVVTYSPNSRASIEMKRLAHFLLGEELPRPGLRERFLGIFRR